MYQADVKNIKVDFYHTIVKVNNKPKKHELRQSNILHAQSGNIQGNLSADINVYS